MSATTWALSWTQPWDTALDRLEQGLDRVEARAGAERADGVAGLEQLPAFELPALDGDLPEHLADRARGLLARTDALAHRVAGELSRTGRELRDLADRMPHPGSERRGAQHPAYLDTRA